MTRKEFALALNYQGLELLDLTTEKQIQKSNNKDKVIFCDFDGTITIEDVVDKLLSMYADQYWKEIEKLWEQSKIGSERCLRLQLACIEHIKESDLLGFALDVAIGPYFPGFLRSVKENGLDLYIVSDGFDWLIKLILLNHGITNIPVFANGLRVKNNKPMPSFPFKTNQCCSGSGMCKCSIINEYRGNKSVTYIGDGGSDICAVRKADVVFAKNKLSHYCAENAIDFVQFSNFGDIMKALFKKEKKNAVR